MFGFALFDSAAGRLLLARDRLGIKPMYWAEVPRGLAFSSEVRALVRAGRLSVEPDTAALAGYLLRGVIPGPRTWARQVREVPPGSYLQWEAGRWQVERWWRPEATSDPVLRLGGEDLLRAALTDAVSRHLVADRAVGVFLSSGVDSGAVTRLAARRGAVKALTVTFPDSDRDEQREATQLARQVGADHESVPVTGRDIAESLPDILRAMDQPTSDGVNTWIVCRAAKQAGLVVALSGLGGDEIFGGYPSFRMVPRLSRLASLLGRLPAPVRNRAAGVVSLRNPGARLARMLGAGSGYAGAYAAVRGLFAPADLHGSYGAEPWADPVCGQAPSAECSGSTRQSPLHPHTRVSLLEMANYLPDQLLRDTDQMAMAHALEVRVPLLDDVVVGVALALPAEIRFEPGKALLARAAGFPEVPLKRPFSLPFDRWIRGPLNDAVRGGLLSEDLPLRQLVPAELRRRLWEGFEAGRVHWSRPWAVTVLRLWPEANGINFA
jgi:asparagine synthase (glutamine-hydrolysing)